MSGVKESFQCRGIEANFNSSFVHRTLNTSLEKCKRKYEAKVKRLEGQLQDLNIRCGGGGGGVVDVKCSLPSPNRSSGHNQRLAESSSNPMTSSVTMCKQRSVHQQHVPETTL